MRSTVFYMLTMARTFILSRIPILAHGFTPSSSSLVASRFGKIPPMSCPGGGLLSYGRHRLLASVTGTVYTSPQDDGEAVPITVKLFTKEGCTLCDKVKDVLVDLREVYPHSLEQVDITDEEHSDWFSKYKYDIPVLHLENKFWIKHRMTVEEATNGLIQAKKGTFQERPGEPDAGSIERKQQAQREPR